MLVWESMNVFKIILSKRNLCPAKIFKSNNVNEWAGSRSNTSIEIVFNYYGKNQIFVVKIFLFEIRQIFMNLLIRKRSVSKYIFLLPLFKYTWMGGKKIFLVRDTSKAHRLIYACICSET